MSRASSPRSVRSTSRASTAGPSRPVSRADRCASRSQTLQHEVKLKEVLHVANTATLKSDDPSKAQLIRVVGALRLLGVMAEESGSARGALLAIKETLAEGIFSDEITDSADSGVEELDGIGLPGHDSLRDPALPCVAQLSYGAVVQRQRVELQALAAQLEAERAQARLLAEQAAARSAELERLRAENELTERACRAKTEDVVLLREQLAAAALTNSVTKADLSDHTLLLHRELAAMKVSKHRGRAAPPRARTRLTHPATHSPHWWWLVLLRAATLRLGRRSGGCARPRARTSSSGGR